jgi:tetratricopeptide (TPR) repeat protein
MLDLCEAEYQAGIESMDRGQYRKAAAKFKASIERATNEGLLLYRMRSMFAYIEVLTLSGDTVKAEKLLNSTINESERMFVGKEAFHALTLSSASRHHFLHSGNAERALPLLREAASILKDSSIQEMPELTEVFFRLLDCLRESGHLEEAVRVGEDLIVFCKKQLGAFDAAVVFAYFLLIDTLRMIGTNEKEKWFQQLVVEFRRHCEMITTDKADIVPTIAIGDCKNSYKHFGMALWQAYCAQLRLR